jgi:hypothetical protein
MLPASKNIAVASQKMRTAVEIADPVVQARRRVQFPEGRGLLDRLIGLNAWCKVTVLRLNSCGLREGGGRGAGRDAAPLHHACVARAWLEWPGRGRRAIAGRGTAPQHHCYVARPWRQ